MAIVSLQWKTNRKSYAIYRMVMFKDLERPITHLSRKIVFEGGGRFPTPIFDAEYVINGTEIDTSVTFRLTMDKIFTHAYTHRCNFE